MTDELDTFWETVREKQLEYIRAELIRTSPHLFDQQDIPDTFLSRPKEGRGPH